MGTGLEVIIPLALSAAGTGVSLYGQKREKDRMGRAEDKAEEAEARMKKELKDKELQRDAGKSAQLARRRIQTSAPTAVTPYGAIGLSDYGGAGARSLGRTG